MSWWSTVAGSAAGSATRALLDSQTVQRACTVVSNAFSATCDGVGGIITRTAAGYRDPNGERAALRNSILARVVDPLVAARNRPVLIRLYNMLALLSVAARPAYRPTYPRLRTDLTVFLQRLLSLDPAIAQSLATDLITLTTHHLDPVYSDDAPIATAAVGCVQSGTNAGYGKPTGSISQILMSIYNALHSASMSGAFSDGAELLPVAVLPSVTGSATGGAVLEQRPSAFRIATTMLASNPIAVAYLSGHFESPPQVADLIPFHLALAPNPVLTIAGHLDEIGFSVTSGDFAVLLHTLTAGQVIHSVSADWYTRFLELASSSDGEPTRELYQAWKTLIAKVQVNPRAPTVNILSQLMASTGLPDFVPLLLLQHLETNGVTYNKVFSLEDAQLVDAAYRSDLSHLGQFASVPFRFIPHAQAPSMAAFCRLWHVNSPDRIFMAELKGLLSSYFSHLHLFVTRSMAGKAYADKHATPEKLDALCRAYGVVGLLRSGCDVFERLNERFREVFHFGQGVSFAEAGAPDAERAWMGVAVQLLIDRGAMHSYLTCAPDVGPPSAAEPPAHPITLLHAGPREAGADGSIISVSLAHSVVTRSLSLPRSLRGAVMVESGVPMHVVGAVPATQRLAPRAPITPPPFALRAGSIPRPPVADAALLSAPPPSSRTLSAARRLAAAADDDGDGFSEQSGEEDYAVGDDFDDMAGHEEERRPDAASAAAVVSTAAVLPPVASIGDVTAAMEALSAALESGRRLVEGMAAPAADAKVVEDADRADGEVVVAHVDTKGSAKADKKAAGSASAPGGKKSGRRQ